MAEPTPQAEWHAKKYGGYERQSLEAFENAIMTYNLLSSLGWTLGAICGFWGNVEAESGYNPWRWESDIVLNRNDPLIATSTIHGYGLPQFTPSGKYILDSNAQNYDGYGPNFNDYAGSVWDGDAQERFINEYADYIPTVAYPMTFDAYKANDTDPPETLAKAWLLNYERPGDQSQAVQAYRASIARYWYDKLIQYDPSDPLPPPITELYSMRRFKIMFYLKPRWKR